MIWVLETRPDLFEATVAAQPSLVSVSFGDPAPYVGPLHDAGIAVCAQVNTTADVHRALDAGVDVLVAQGTEAGGHTGRRATLPLLQEVLTLTDRPVVAAGGIATGRGMAAALVAGAAGVWIGTPLLSCTEGLNAPALRERVRAASGDETVLTRAFDVAEGAAWPERWPGRALVNDFSREWHGREDELAGDPGRPPAGGRGPPHRRPGPRPDLRRGVGRAGDQRAVGHRRRPGAGRRGGEGAAGGAAAARLSQTAQLSSSQPSAAGTVTAGARRPRPARGSAAAARPAARPRRRTSGRRRRTGRRSRRGPARSRRPRGPRRGTGGRSSASRTSASSSPTSTANGHQRVDVEDRAALLEVGVQQPLLELVALAVLGGQVQQLVGEQGVAADAVGQVVLEALVGGDLLDARHVGPHLLDAARRTWRPARGASGASRPRGREGSSWKDRQTTSTWSRCGNCSRALSSRRLPM